MEQAIVIFVKDKSIDKLRKKYDGRSIKSHLTLVYPFLADKESISRVRKFVKTFKPFEISFSGLSKSKKDYYLYLNVDKNKKKLLELHRKLYKILGLKFNNPDMPRYEPHVSLGIFDSEGKIDKVMKKLESQNLNLTFQVNKISLITLGRGLASESVEDIYLSRDIKDKNERVF